MCRLCDIEYDDGPASGNAVSKRLFDVMYQAVRDRKTECPYQYLLGFAHALMLVGVISAEEWRKVQDLPEVIGL